MQTKVIRDANAGNSCPHHHWLFAVRMYCVQVGTDYLRDKAGRGHVALTREGRRASQINPT